MKDWTIHLRFRVERSLATISWMRVAAIPLFLAGGIACFSSGLDLLWAPVTKSFLALLVGIAYIGIGALLWGME